MKDLTITTAKDKVKATEAVEKKAQASEKAWILVEKRLTEMDMT